MWADELVESCTTMRVNPSPDDRKGTATALRPGGVRGWNFDGVRHNRTEGGGTMAWIGIITNNGNDLLTRWWRERALTVTRAAAGQGRVDPGGHAGAGGPGE